MITRFKNFLNENNDDIRKNLTDRINKAINNIILKHPKREESKKTEPKKTVQPEKDKPESKIEKPRELRLKSIKIKGLEDKRLIDALSALTSLGYDEKTVKEFLKNIEEIYPETTSEDIIKFGVRNLSKF